MVNSVINIVVINMQALLHLPFFSIDEQIRLKYWDMELALLYGDKQNLVHCMHVRCDCYIATETARAFSLDKLALMTV